MGVRGGAFFFTVDWDEIRGTAACPYLAGRPTLRFRRVDLVDSTVDLGSLSSAAISADSFGLVGSSALTGDPD